MLLGQLILHFAAVAEHLSFRAAAEALRVDQATLSRRVKQLEQRLGVRLFDRTTRSVRLTPEGETLLPAALELARAEQRAAQAVDALVSQASAVLRLGSHPYIYWSGQLNAVLSQFATDVRGTTVRSVTGMSNRHIQRLLDGSLDIAVIVDRDLRDDIELLPLMDVRPNLLLPTGHPLAGLSELALADLQDQPIAMVPPGRDSGDFEAIYGAFFRDAARMVRISDGPPALMHQAARDGLPMISLRPLDAAPPAGFVRRPVTDAPRVRFALARKAGATRSLADRFWNSAQRALE